MVTRTAKTSLFNSEYFTWKTIMYSSNLNTKTYTTHHQHQQMLYLFKFTLN